MVWVMHILYDHYGCGCMLLTLFIISIIFPPESTGPRSNLECVTCQSAMQSKRENALCGILILLIGSTRFAGLRNLVSWLFLMTLALPFNWIAFGVGERQFSGSLSLGAVLMNNISPGESEGRVVFGIFALLLDLMVFFLPFQMLKRGDSEHDS